MPITSPSIGTTGSTPGQPYSQAKAELEKAAKAFEAVFMRQMIGAMRQASLDEGIGDSSATMQFRDMADARTADSMAEKGSMGIAQLLLQQLSAKLPHDPAATTTDGKTGIAKGSSE